MGNVPCFGADPRELLSGLQLLTPPLPKRGKDGAARIATPSQVRFFPGCNSPQPVSRYHRPIPTPFRWRLRNLGNRYAPFMVGECKSPTPKSRLREGAQKSLPHHRFGSSRAVTLHNRSRGTKDRFQHYSDGAVQVAPFLHLPWNVVYFLTLSFMVGATINRNSFLDSGFFGLGLLEGQWR